MESINNCCLPPFRHPPVWQQRAGRRSGPPQRRRRHLLVAVRRWMPTTLIGCTRRRCPSPAGYAVAVVYAFSIASFGFCSPPLLSCPFLLRSLFHTLSSSLPPLDGAALCSSRSLTDPLPRPNPSFSLQCCGGLVKDCRRRGRVYKSDFVDGFTSVQSLSSIGFIFFAAFAPAVTFGGVMSEQTSTSAFSTCSLASSFGCGGYATASLDNPRLSLPFTSALVVSCRRCDWSDGNADGDLDLRDGVCPAWRPAGGYHGRHRAVACLYPGALLLVMRCVCGGDAWLECVVRMRGCFTEVLDSHNFLF